MNRKQTGSLSGIRTAALAAAAVLAAGALWGCGARAGGTGARADVVKDGRVQVTLWYSGGKTAAGVMEELIGDFNSSQQQYQVTGIQQADYDETYTKLAAAIAGKTGADAALLDSDKARSLAEKGLLAGLNPYFEADEELETEDFVPVFYDQCRLGDGTVFAMPAYGTTQVMYYNRELFDRAGIDPERIGTWQDLERAAEAVSGMGGEEKLYGWEPMWGPDNLVDIALSNGGSLLSADGTRVTINSDQWVESWELVRRGIHDAETMAIHSGGQGWEYWYQTMDDVLEGRAGGYTGSSGDQADLDFSVVGAMEQPGFGENPPAPVARVLQLVMVETGKAETKQGVYEFMKFFARPANQARWSMATGYIPVRASTLEDEGYKAYTQENPQALVPLSQAMHASPMPIDPTGGKIFDALEIAADKVEIENVPVREALDEACRTAQKALDEAVR